MKLASGVSRKRGRIEIIPLIDIMFFLLAAFMMVSIHKIKVKSLQVSLPTDVPVAQLESKEDFVSISINAQGQVQLDKELLTDPNALLPRLQGIYATHRDEKFLVSADKDARSGDMIAVLGKLRTAGFQRVAFSLNGNSGTVPSAGMGPGAPAAAPSAPLSPAAPPSTAVPATPLAPSTPVSMPSMPSTAPAAALPTSPAAPPAPPAAPSAPPAAPPAPAASPPASTNP
jgi:biopolymer transport protein ExbD